MRMNLLEEYARHKAQKPADWFLYVWNALEDNLIKCTGAIFPLLDGKPNFKGKMKPGSRAVVYVIRSDYEIFCRDWESRNDKCYVCEGTGKEWNGWSRDAGVKYKICSKCGGSGKP